MKLKALIFGLAYITFVACKKERTCNCTITNEVNSRTRTQTAGTTIAIPGLPVPPITLIAGKDTTVNSFYTYTSTEKFTYDKASKRNIKKKCLSYKDETTGDQSVIKTQGTSTVTITKSETKTYSCEIE